MISVVISSESIVVHWCNPLTLQSEQSGGGGSIPSMAPSPERHDKGLRTRLALSYFCDPSAWRKMRQPHCTSLHLTSHQKEVFTTGLREGATCETVQLIYNPLYDYLSKNNYLFSNSLALDLFILLSLASSITQVTGM